MSKRERNEDGDFKSDLWRTPPWLFDILNREYKFAVDLAASKDNHLLPKYYTRENSAIGKKWPKNRFSFCNPPFSVPNLGNFTAEAAAQQIDNRYSVFLLPAYVMEGWFEKYIYGCASRLVLFTGRLCYYTPEGVESEGNRFGSCVAEFGERKAPGPCTDIRWRSLTEVRASGLIY